MNVQEPSDYLQGDAQPYQTGFPAYPIERHDPLRPPRGMRPVSSIQLPRAMGRQVHAEEVDYFMDRGSSRSTILGPEALPVAYGYDYSPGNLLPTYLEYVPNASIDPNTNNVTWPTWSSGATHDFRYLTLRNSGDFPDINDGDSTDAAYGQYTYKKSFPSPEAVFFQSDAENMTLAAYTNMIAGTQHYQEPKAMYQPGLLYIQNLQPRTVPANPGQEVVFQEANMLQNHTGLAKSPIIQPQMDHFESMQTSPRPASILSTYVASELPTNSSGSAPCISQIQGSSCTCERSPLRPKRRDADLSTTNKPKDRRLQMSTKIPGWTGVYAPCGTGSGSPSPATSVTHEPEDSKKRRVKIFDINMKPAPKTRTRLLSPSGRDHARGVRKIGACMSCKRAKRKCTHVLDEDIQFPTEHVGNEVDVANNSLQASQTDLDSINTPTTPWTPQSPWTPQFDSKS